MKQFETNKTYTNSFIGDSELFFSFKIIRRTAKSVWIKDAKREGKVMRRKIGNHNNEETIFPMGYYSMCPVLGADDEVKNSIII